jgi:hypothetical protein
MLTIRPTPRLAGLSISGDLQDLQALYEALSDIIGDESLEGGEYEMPALNILAICYELRQAWQGNRQVEFIENGLSDDMRQNLKVLAPARNVYFKTRIHLPEILFDIMTLNDFIEMGNRRTKLPDLDPVIQRVRCFQADVTAVLTELLDPAAGARLTRLIYGSVPRYRSFYTHYVDELTAKYLKQTPEKRQQQIIPLARRLDALGDDYRRLESDLVDTAAELNCQVSDLEPVTELPVLEDGEW